MSSKISRFVNLYFYYKKNIFTKTRCLFQYSVLVIWLEKTYSVSIQLVFSFTSAGILSSLKNDCSRCAIAMNRQLIDVWLLAYILIYEDMFSDRDD